MGLEQLRLLLLVALLLALYYCNMTQTLVLGLVCGLLASSFDLSRHDSMLIGVFSYVMLSLLPILAGAAVHSGFRSPAGRAARVDAGRGWVDRCGDWFA